MVTAGLQPLEFTDCLLDSPEFRENLNKHEKELEKTSQQIKRIIKEVKDLLAAAKREFYIPKKLKCYNFQAQPLIRFGLGFLLSRSCLFDAFHWKTLTVGNRPSNALSTKIEKSKFEHEKERRTMRGKGFFS